MKSMNNQKGRERIKELIDLWQSGERKESICIDVLDCAENLGATQSDTKEIMSLLENDCEPGKIQLLLEDLAEKFIDRNE